MLGTKDELNYPPISQKSEPTTKINIIGRLKAKAATKLDLLQKLQNHTF